MEEEVKKRKTVIESLSELSTIVGGMTFFASIFEILNIGRFIEMMLALSTRAAFGLEVLIVVTIPFLLKAFYKWLKKGKRGNYD